MICKNCGTELKEGIKFCWKCGTPVPAEETTFSVKETAGADAAASGGGRKWILGAVGAVCGIVLIAGVAFAVTRWGGSSTEQTAASARQTAADDTDADIDTDADTDTAEEPLYTITDVGTVDLTVLNHTPGTKQAGSEWDKSMFYWLEDADPTSTEDGNISSCLLTKTQLRNTSTGTVVQYDIYRDPDNGTICKIVSVEAQAEGGYLLTDYYYWLGMPNFIFRRTDSVYTPTYATTDKVGDRFYFSNDVMVRWRTINTPREIEESTLTMMDVAYQQTDYFTDTEENRARYDAAELEKLNEAYNTLEAVTSQPVIGIAAGTVKDTLGNPMAGLTVDICRTADDVLLYRGTTGEDGGFWILTYLDGTDCYIRIKGDEVYRDVTVSGVTLADTSLMYTYENLVRHKNSGDEYPVQLALHSAADVNTETGNPGSAVPGAAVTFREGTSAYTGEAAATAQADENGYVSVNLPSGTYTVQIEAAGYAVSYLTVEVAEAAVTADGYLLPAPAEGQTGIVMTWDGTETDLDLTIFTPYQSTGGDMAHIGGSLLNDGNGNYIMADNTAGCEAAYINTAETGTFKLYVNDYTDSQAGNYTAETLAVINVHIYIYDSTGLVAVYTVPVGQNGVVWEVAEISGSRITPSQRVYTQIEGKSWWLTKGASVDELFDAFFANEIPAYYDGFDESRWWSEYVPDDYTIGERVDLDNDGEKEQVIRGVFYGGIYLDVRDGTVYILAQGGGTDHCLSYTYYDNAVWILYSDTTHQGRQSFWLEKYDGSGNIVDELTLYAEEENWASDDYNVFEYWDEETYKQLSKEEYEALRKEILDGQVSTYSW